MGGDPRGRRDRLQPHRHVRPGQPGLAGGPAAAPPGRGGAALRAEIPRGRPGLLRHGEAVERAGQVRPGAGPARRRLRGRRRRDGPRPLAHRELRPQPRGQGARRLPGRADPCRPPLPDGAGAPEGRLGERRPGGRLRGRRLRQPRARPPGRGGQVLRRRGRARRRAAVAARGRLLHLLPGAVSPPGRQARGRRRRARHGAEQPGRAGRRRRVVDRAPDRGAQAPRPRRCQDRLRGGEPAGGALAREAHRGRVPRRLDRAPLRRRSRRRRAAFRPGGGDRREPDLGGAGRLLAGTGGRGARPVGGGEALLRARRPAADRLLRPGGPGPARPDQPAPAGAGRPRGRGAPGLRRAALHPRPRACSARPGSRSWPCRSTSTPPGTSRTRASSRRSATSPPT